MKTVDLSSSYAFQILRETQGDQIILQQLVEECNEVVSSIVQHSMVDETVTGRLTDDILSELSDVYLNIRAMEDMLSYCSVPELYSCSISPNTTTFRDILIATSNLSAAASKLIRCDSINKPRDYNEIAGPLPYEINLAQRVCQWLMLIHGSCQGFDILEEMAKKKLGRFCEANNIPVIASPITSPIEED